MKRRSGTIGISPRALDKAKKAAPVVARPTAAAAPVAAKPAAPVAAIGKNMSDEKRARLEAIPGRQGRRRGRTSPRGRGGDGG